MVQEVKEDKGVFRQQKERVRFIWGTCGRLIWNHTLSCQQALDIWIFAEVLPLGTFGKGSHGRSLSLHNWIGITSKSREDTVNYLALVSSTQCPRRFGMLSGATLPFELANEVR